MDIKQEFRDFLNEAKKVKEITQEEAVEVISKLFGKDEKLDEFFLSFFKKNFTYAILPNSSKKWEEYKDELENEDNAHLVEKLYSELYNKYRKFLDSIKWI